MNEYEVNSPLPVNTRNTRNAIDVVLALKVKGKIMVIKRDERSGKEVGL